MPWEAQREKPEDSNTGQDSVMQYRPDLREEATLGDLKEGARNNDESQYIRDCDSTEEEEEHKNNLI